MGIRTGNEIEILSCSEWDPIEEWHAGVQKAWNRIEFEANGVNIKW
jgi:hypothetical protein